MEPRNLCSDKLPGVAIAGPQTVLGATRFRTGQGPAGGEGCLQGRTPRAGDKDGCQQNRVEKLWQEEYVQMASARSGEGYQGSTAQKTPASSAQSGPGSGETRWSLLDGGWGQKVGRRKYRSADLQQRALLSLSTCLPGQTGMPSLSSSHKPTLAWLICMSVLQR